MGEGGHLRSLRCRHLLLGKPGEPFDPGSVSRRVWGVDAHAAHIVEEEALEVIARWEPAPLQEPIVDWPEHPGDGPIAGAPLKHLHPCGNPRFLSPGPRDR
jgi:hypothetical protein